jgi:asparagine synthase (glutamine-hydrolysing)
MYNGEIYNYKQFGDFKSDGECIIPIYQEKGENFIKELDGEFAICLIDYNKKIAIVSSDIFKTKPLFLGFDDNNFGCSSYKTPLEKLKYEKIFKAEANTIYTICLNTYKIIKKEKIYNFDLTQKSYHYFGWLKAFHDAVKKRIQNTDKKVFIGLSSGYDSGLIYHELCRLDHSFYSFSVLGKENEDVIYKRINLKNKNANCFLLKDDKMEYQFSHILIKKRTEPFFYTIKSDSSDYREEIPLINDSGSNKFAMVCKNARKYDCKICLSGSGADEIISDYGFQGEKKYPHSNFGGLFPSDLNTIFPWASFYGSTLESYIAKEEYVGGSFGIEVRYPFLDKNVVQEFLWLHHSLKNEAYKAPMAYYFDKIGFPYVKNEKIGF